MFILIIFAVVFNGVTAATTGKLASAKILLAPGVTWLKITSSTALIASCTAMAGEMLGMKLIYMDGGSGSGRVISSEMIQAVKQQVDLPLIVGGGINNPEQASEVWNAGADIIVVGNAIENDLTLISSIASQLKSII